MEIDRRTYQVCWSENDQAYVGSCLEFPDERFLGSTLDEALIGIRGLVVDHGQGRLQLGRATLLAEKAASIAHAVPKYRLDELIALCNPNAEVASDMKTWSAVRPVGRELI